MNTTNEELDSPVNGKEIVISMYLDEKQLIFDISNRFLVCLNFKKNIF